MSASFSTRDDGMIEAQLGSGDGVLNHALNDAITSRAPSGAVYAGLSTYWIDHAEAALRRALRDKSSDRIAAGNATYLRLEGTAVLAVYDFDPDETEAESIPVSEFLALLADWRAAVVDAGGANGAEASLIKRGAVPRPMGPAT